VTRPMTATTRGCIEFAVRGQPLPQGSVRAFVRDGRAIVVGKGRTPLADWRQAIASEARSAMSGLPAFGGPVDVRALFVFGRPRSHFRTDGRSLRSGAPRYPRTDIDKLTRALLDALTGVVVDDDSQFTSLTAEKGWDDVIRGWQGVKVWVTERLEGNET